jgi:glycosyltransferase involved in cell wall biosynthesis
MNFDKWRIIKKMRILHIPTGGLFLDGIFSCISAYATAMDRTNLEIVIIASNQPSREIAEQVKQINCKLIIIPYRKVNTRKYITELWQFLRREQFDIVHVHGSSSIMSIELILAKFSGCKVRISHSHNTTCDNKCVDKLLRPIFKYSFTHAFACGMDAGKWLFGNREFIIQHNARDLNKYEYREQERLCWREKLSLTEKCLVIGHVGRFNYQKNHEYIIRIFKEINKKNPTAHLVLIGTGEYLNNIKDEVNKFSLSENVHFLGEISNVENVLSAIDIMILPSRYEGLPVVVIEWQASGLPCLISDSITDECIITDLVRKLSIEEMPDVWADAILHTNLANRVSVKSEVKEKLQKSGYDIQNGAKKLKQLYQTFISENY